MENYERDAESHMQQKSIGIIGAGLAGTMVATLLAKLGFSVSLFEKRPNFVSGDLASHEFGNSLSASKRSINLALSHRGMCALKEIGILDVVMKNAIRMPCRVIHMANGSVLKQAYGKDDEALQSVCRQTLNSILMDQVMKFSNSTGKQKIRAYFGYSLQALSKTGHCSFLTPEEKVEEFDFDLVVGADGAYSTARDCLLRQGRINFSRQYIAHGYKELTIPPSISCHGQPKYALDNVKGLHIWPRGEFMLIALPNPDHSFTATLFAPYQSPEGGFNSINPKDADAVHSHFQKHFPDVVPLMPNLAQEYRENPVGSLVSIRVEPWNIGKAVLLGDAAHAVVPFYGQGMNAAFEDCLVLYECIKDQLRAQELTRSSCAASRYFKNFNSVENLEAVDLCAAAAEFARLRTPAAAGLSDLCVEHYHDMASNTASVFYLLRKKVEAVVHWLLPQQFIPLYTMVAFTRIPYHLAIERAKRQQSIMNWIVAAVQIVLLALVVAGILLYRNQSEATASLSGLFGFWGAWLTMWLELGTYDASSV